MEEKRSVSDDNSIKKRRAPQGTNGIKKRRPRPEVTEQEGMQRRPQGARPRPKTAVKTDDARSESGRPQQRSTQTVRRRPQQTRAQQGTSQQMRRQQSIPQAEKSSEMKRTQMADAARRKSAAARRRKRKMIRNVILVLVGILIICALAAAVLWRKYGPSDQKADLNEYYGMKAQNQSALVIDNEIVDGAVLSEEDRIYLEYSIVRDYISDRYYWDAGDRAILYALPEELVRVQADRQEYYVGEKNENSDYAIVKMQGDTPYIALEFIKNYTDIEYAHYSNPSRVVVDTDWSEKTVAEVKRGAKVRKLGGFKSPVLTEPEKGDQVTILEETGSWRKVRTKDGLIGYIHESKLKNEKKTIQDRAFQEPDYTSISKDYTINLGWHQVTTMTANSGVADVIDASKGLNTLSPTWFSISDNEGNIASIASSDYVNAAHRAGIEVWGLVDNFSENINSHTVLSSFASRSNIITQLMEEAKQVGLDGINVDFENIAAETGEHYIQFIRELSIECRKEGLILSVDNYVPGYTDHYNRKEQGVFVDYVIIMGYDEHYAGSPEAGSVASYGFVKEGIEQTLKEVPAEKVINGIPFFTRLWAEEPKTEEQLQQQAGTDAAQYPNVVTSKALGMEAAANTVANAGVQATWDDRTKQNVATWESDGVTYKIWLEDAKSIQEKLNLMADYDLAGVAQWKLGFETSDIWDIIAQYVQ